MFRDFLEKKGGFLLAGIPCVMVLLFLVYQFTLRQEISSETDYLRAAVDFQRMEDLVQDPVSFATTFAKWSDVVDRHPELTTKYDGAIAQLLLQQGKHSEALPYAERAVQRLDKEGLSFYSDYAATTLIIAKNQYSLALQQALSLQNKMKEADHGAGEVLQALNLLRIAALQQAIGAPQDELIAWQEFTNRAEDSQVSQHTDGDVTFESYAQHRLTHLSSNG